MARLELVKAASPDDGKSTLIGRLLYDSKLVYDDQLAGLASDSKRSGTAGGDLDFALLIDGLQAEREQGITIDVAYRYFSTPKRKFIVADTPGHEQYTRNMATGASTCDFAVLLVDARQGILAQTRRHACIVSLLGIRRLALAVNKMDLVGFAENAFTAIRDEFDAFAAPLGISAAGVPAVAPDGDNVVHKSARMPWYGGPTVLGWLESVEVLPTREAPLRLLVQGVTRPNGDFRGYAGYLASGAIEPGDPVDGAPGDGRGHICWWRLGLPHARAMGQPGGGFSRLCRHDRGRDGACG